MKVQKQEHERQDRLKQEVQTMRGKLKEIQETIRKTQMKITEKRK